MALVLALAIVALLIKHLLKRRCKLIRTPFDLELRGKREDELKRELSTYFCGNILVSLNILREQKNFFLANSRYCYEHMPLKPEARKKIQNLMNRDEEITSHLLELQTTVKGNVSSSLKRRKTGVQSWVMGLLPSVSSPKMSVGSPRVQIGSLAGVQSESNINFSRGFGDGKNKQTDLLVLNKSLSFSEIDATAFKKDLSTTNLLGSDFAIQFSKKQRTQLSMDFAARRSQLVYENKDILKTVAAKFNVKLDPTLQRSMKAETVHRGVIWKLSWLTLSE